MRCVKFFTLGLVAVLAGGCSDFIDFEAETIVFPDGGATRKSRFAVEHHRGKRDVEVEFILPPGGRWDEGKRLRAGPDKTEREYNTIEYGVERKYQHDSDFDSDFRRRAKHSTQEAHNEPRLVVRDYLFVKTFEYEERFRDIVTPESFEKTARNVYAFVIERSAEHLVRQRQDGLTRAEANTAIRTVFDPLLDRLLNAVRNEGLRTTIVALFQGEFNDALEPQQVAAQVIDVLPPPAGHDSASWRKAITDAYEAAGAAAFKENPALEEEVFGAYGLSLFGPEYGFKVVLSLPGVVVDSNATQRKEGKLIWIFKRHDFLYQDHVLRAHSRSVYPERIVLAIAALFAIFAAWWAIRVRTTRNRTDSSHRESL